MNDLIKTFNAAFEQNFDAVVAYLPKFLYFFLLLSLGYLLSKVIAYIPSALYKKIISRVQLANSEANSRFSTQVIPKILDNLLFWISLIFFIVVALDIFKIQIIENLFLWLTNYLPHLLLAIIILLLGFLLAQAVSTVIKRKIIDTETIHSIYLAETARWFILLITISIALTQAGIEHSLIVNIVSLILGAILLSFSLAFGLSVPKLIAQFLTVLTLKQEFNIDDQVKIEDFEGTIVSFSNTAITIASEDGLHRVPANYFLKHVVKIKLTNDHVD